jgi:hypothetical protein
MINILILIISFLVNAIACEVHLPEQIVIIGLSAKITDSVAKNGCKEGDLEKVNETLQGIEGSVTNLQLQEILKQKGVTVSVHPSLIKIHDIKSLVREQILLPAGTQLEKITINGPEQFLPLTHQDKIQVECKDCSFGPGQEMTLIVQETSGNSKRITSFASFKRLIKAYRVISFHPAFAPIEVTSLKEEQVEAVPYTDLVEDLSSLKFFRTNKPLRSGDLLRTADLKAENLVRAGTKTEVIIENEMLRLKTSGLSRSNGSWGQFVEVFHPERNKKYLGKVIDINKVLVEL